MNTVVGFEADEPMFDEPMSGRKNQDLTGFTPLLIKIGVNDNNAFPYQ
jgi:hypothetical protein